MCVKFFGSGLMAEEQSRFEDEIAAPFGLAMTGKGASRLAMTGKGGDCHALWARNDGNGRL